MENYEELFAVCLDGNLGDGIGFDFLEPARQFESIYIYIYIIYYIYLGKVKRVPREKWVKVISTSGDTLDKQRKIYKNLEVSYFLEKPFSRNALLNALKSLQEE